MELKLTDDIVTERDIQDVRTVISRVNQYVTQNNLPVYVAKSKLPDAGFGLFARRDIEANQVVTEYGGNFLTKEQVQFLTNRDYLYAYPQSLVKIVMKELDSNSSKMLRQLNKDWKGTFLDGRVGFRLSEMGRWINSTSPLNQNVVSEFAGTRDNGKTWIMHLVAIRDISKGEEILWNYGDQYGSMLGTELCISCNLHDAAWAEQHDLSKQFCSHMCQRQFYGIQKKLIFE